jgi:hypothetical protein
MPADTHLQKPLQRVRVQKIITAVVSVPANSINEAFDIIQKKTPDTRIPHGTQSVQWRVISEIDTTQSREINPSRY